MIVLLLILIVLVIGFGVIQFSKSKIKRIELDVELIPSDLDNVFEDFKIRKRINISGLLGTDFLDKYGYVIDFKRNRIWHNIHYISFREAMELINIPCVVLCQGDKKYLFIVDSGSSMSHISSEALMTLDYELDTSKNFTTVGCGGGMNSQGLVKTKLYYR